MDRVLVWLTLQIERWPKMGDIRGTPLRLIGL